MTFDNFDFIGMLTFAITLDLQLLFLGVDSQADKASFPVRRYDLLDRIVKVANVLEGPLAILWRGYSIGHGEAKRFNVGADSPLELRQHKVAKLSLSLPREIIVVREGFNGVSEFTSEEGRLADQHSFEITIALLEVVSDALDVIHLTLVQSGERLHGDSLAELVDGVGFTLLPRREAIGLAKFLYAEILLTYLVP